MAAVQREQAEARARAAAAEDAPEDEVLAEVERAIAAVNGTVVPRCHIVSHTRLESQAEPPVPHTVGLAVAGINVLELRVLGAEVAGDEARRR